MATIKAQNACKEWLKMCLDFGWDASMLGDLEKLWWEYHDQFGKLISATGEATDGRG